MTVSVLEVLGRSEGGVGRHVARVCGALDAVAGLRVDIAAPPAPAIPMPKQVIPVPIPQGAIGGHARAIGILRSVIQRHHYDVVHAHGLRAGTDAAMAVKGSRARLIYTVHNVIHPQIAGNLRARIFGRTEVIPVRASAKTFAASAEIARHITSRWPEAAPRVEVLHLGVGDAPAVTRPRAEVRSELGLREDDLLVVTVARLAPQKALHVMVEAVAALDRTHLCIVGDGPLRRRLEALRARLGVSDRVHLVGFKVDVGDYVAAGDVFCISSVWEAVALAAQEAVLLDVPVVTTAVGGMTELFEDGVSGRVVPADDPDALAGALRELLGSPETARRYATAARRTLERDFSTQRMLDRLQATYLEG